MPGAERIGIVLGETATAHDWASLIDHTLLNPRLRNLILRNYVRRRLNLVLRRFA